MKDFTPIKEPKSHPYTVLMIHSSDGKVDNFLDKQCEWCSQPLTSIFGLVNTGCSEMKDKQNLAQSWLIFDLRFFQKPSKWSQHP